MSLHTRVAGLAAVIALTGGLVAHTVLAQATPPRPAPAPQTTAPATVQAPVASGAATPVTTPSEYAFPSGAGMLFFYVKPDKAADFDGVITRIKDALAKSSSAVRRQQANGWKVYKWADKPADPPVAGTPIVYVWMIDPAIAKGDYNPVSLFEETLPAEMQPLFTRMKDDVVKIERMGLTLVKAMGNQQ